MPRFFFDIDDGHQAARDHEGISLADEAQAKILALQTLTDVICSSTEPCQTRLYAVTVRRSDHAVYARATVRMTTDWDEVQT